MKSDPINRFVMRQVARHRVQKRIRIVELAKGSGIPLGTISCILTGHCRCSLFNLHRPLAHLGVSIREVWPETDPIGITPLVTARTIQVVLEEAEARLAPLLTLDQILVAVCEVYGLHLNELASPSRRRYLSEARAVSALLVSEQPQLKVVRLAEWFHRDASTFFHTARRMEERLTYDPGLAERLEAVRKLLA